MRYGRRYAVPLIERLSLLLPLLLGAGGLSTAAHAQITNTWTGQGTDGNWSTAGNWDANGVPASNSATGLDFTGTAATSNNNLGTFELDLMQFDVGADFALSGGALNFVSHGGTAPSLTQDTTFSVTLNNNLTLTNNLTVYLAGSGTVNLTGVISGTGGLFIYGYSGSYTTILTNANNSYRGGTVVAGGTLQLGATNALPSGQNLQVTGIAADATLDLNGNNATVRNIYFADGTFNSANNMTITDSSSGQTGLLTLNSDIIYNPGTSTSGNLITPTAYINCNLAFSAGQHDIDSNNSGDFSYENYDLIITGPISGSGGLNIGSLNDTGTRLYVALAHANTYSGPTNIINGSLYLGATNAIPMNGAVTVGVGGNLYLYVASDYTETGLTPGSYNQALGSLANNGDLGGKVYLGGATLTVGGANTTTTFSGSILDNDGSSLDPTLVGGSLVKTGTGTLTLSGQSGYTGSTTIDAGTLQLGTSDALPDLVSGVNPDLTVATNLTLKGGAFDTNTFSQTVNNLSNSGGNVLIHGGGSVLTVTGAYTQSAGLTQVDNTLNLTPGQNLTISGGQLVGTGTIGNATASGMPTVTNSGGTVRPGDLLPSLSVGTLKINGNYTQQSGGTLEIDLAGTTPGTTYDVLAVSNNANLAGTLNIKLLNGFAPTVGETFDILTYGGTLNGAFSNINGLDQGYQYSFNASHGIGVLTVTAAVPETSTFVTAGLMLTVGGLLLRRRRQAQGTTQRAA